MVLPMRRKAARGQWRAGRAATEHSSMVETSQPRVSRTERKCHGSALISSRRIIQFRFNFVIRRLRLLVKHDRNESVAFGTNHKHGRTTLRIPRAHSEQRENIFSFRHTVDVWNFIRYKFYSFHAKSQLRRFVSIKRSKISIVKIV